MDDDTVADHVEEEDHPAQEEDHVEEDHHQACAGLVSVHPWASEVGEASEDHVPLHTISFELLLHTVNSMP